MTNQTEFDLLAAAFRQLTEYRLRYPPLDSRMRPLNEMAAELYEAAIARHDLRGLRAGFADLCAEVEDVSWGSDYLQEFQKRYGVSLRDVRGRRSPRARLERILKRGSIETPAELRAAQDRLDSLGDDSTERTTILRLVDDFYKSHPTS